MAERTTHQGGPWWRHWALPLGVGVLVALAVVLVVLWWKAPALYDSSDVDPSGQATATATTRTGILAVIAATIATLGATLALAETRRANLAAHEREREALAETQRANREADQREGYTKAIDQLGT